MILISWRGFVSCLTVNRFQRLSIPTLENIFVQSELARQCRHYSDVTCPIQPKGPPFVPDTVSLPAEA